MADADIDEIIRQAGARVERLISRMNTCPLEEFSCVVHPSGPGGSGGGSAKAWTLIFSVQFWRRANGEIDRREMVIRKPNLTDGQLREAMSLLKKYDVVKLRARISLETEGPDCWDKPQAFLEEIIATGIDVIELRQFARELQKPKFVHDPQLGRLQLDRRTNTLDGFRRIWLRRYRISIELDPDESYRAEMAFEKILHVERHLTQIKQNIIESLFDLYNSNWESLGRLTEKQFLRRISLDCVAVSSTGSVDIYFKDGGLFLNHAILLRIKENGEYGEAHLAG